MSYGYSLLKPLSAAPLSEWPNQPLPTIGPFEDVKQRLDALFPSMAWSWHGATGFGRCADGMEFQLTPEPDGTCSHVGVRRVTREELTALCRRLDLVAIDQQTLELIRP